MTEHVEVRAGVYADSVTLMQVSRRVADVEGIDSALVAMATELNLDVLGGMAFPTPDAGPNDLIVAVRGGDEAIAAALAELETALTDSRGAGQASRLGDEAAPRTIRQTVQLGASLALISVPGEHAYVEALDALTAGLHVMVFSDNVPAEHEVALKRFAADRGLLVMGPDAGTAIIGGVGLGFANVAQPGPVGVVAASGTGAQQLTCLLDDAGVGIAHVIGVGGRDLQAGVGGLASEAALVALDGDPATQVIVLLSKPADADVAARLRAVSSSLSKPVIEALIGPDANNLTEIADQIVAHVGAQALQPASWPATAARASGYSELRGLFAGGTLCDEAMVIASRQLGDVRSNIPLPGGLPLTAGLDTPGHIFVDLGEDEFTRGRPHPMIDQSLRVDRIQAEVARSGSKVLLLDVVLGHAAHPDPAAELAPAIEVAVATGEVAVVISLCGSQGDPQGRQRQAEQFVAAGASVHVSNAAAASEAVTLVGGAS
ncbi:MAG: hypothetical protein WD576_03810 [Nitriliruptoraceae bacterium]